MQILPIATIQTFLLPVAIAASFYLTTNAAAEDAETLFSFTEPESTKNWKSVNDGVMGGRSKGGFKRIERKTLMFTGDLSLENNGGFASIRSNPGALNLGGASGIIVNARGDGRTYRVQLRTDDRMATSYRANLPTVKGEFNEVFIPFSDFKLQTFGQIVRNSKPVDPAAINSIGISVADKKAGPFEFELESIKAFRGEGKPDVKGDGQVKSAIEEANYMDNAVLVSYHPPLQAKMVKMVEMDGPARMINSSPSLRPRIFFDHSDFVHIQQGSNITVYDAKGSEQRSFKIPSEVKFYIGFTILPDGRMAFFDNRNDAVYFLDKEGRYLKTVPIADQPDRRIQYMNGIVVEGKLIVSQNGYNELLSIDLETYDVSVFRSLRQLKGMVGSITYSDGVYYLSQSTDIYLFTAESNDIKKLATVPKGNITRTIVIDDSLFVAVNGKWKRPVEKGAVYEINLKSKTIAEVENALDTPEGVMLLKANENKNVLE